MDQFSRSLYQHNPPALAFEGIALSQKAVNIGCITTTQQPFLIMPFTHQLAIKLFTRPGLENSYNV